MTHLISADTLQKKKKKKRGSRDGERLIEADSQTLKQTACLKDSGVSILWPLVFLTKDESARFKRWGAPLPVDSHSS